MTTLLCVDGSMLTGSAAVCRDKLGDPYELTLELARDQQPFAAVGERCGALLSCAGSAGIPRCGSILAAGG